METSMHIAEVASRSGFPAATLRYYEQRDLLPPPQRTPAGYRAYDGAVLARLAFIARAKALGCTLDEIAGLMPEWDGGRCAPVQDGLRQLASTKLGETEARVAELTAFATDLRRILATLGSHTPDGPCDPDCGCVGERSSRPSPVSPPVGCALDAAQLPGRIQEWRQLLTHVDGRVDIDGGVRLQLDSAVPVDQLALLVRAEQGCCNFFAFAVTVDSRGVALEVRAPAEGLSLIDALLVPAA